MCICTPDLDHKPIFVANHIFKNSSGPLLLFWWNHSSLFPHLIAKIVSVDLQQDHNITSNNSWLGCSHFLYDIIFVRELLDLVIEIGYLWFMILLLQLLITSYFVSRQVISNLCLSVCAWFLSKPDLGLLKQSSLLEVYFAFNHWKMAIECTMNNKFNYYHLPKFELTIIKWIWQNFNSTTLLLNLY